MAVFLSQNGADTSIRNHKGESPLDLASLYGRVDTVRLLLLKCPALVCRYIIVYQDLNVDKLSHVVLRNGNLWMLIALYMMPCPVFRSLINMTPVLLYISLLEMDI